MLINTNNGTRIKTMPGKMLYNSSYWKTTNTTNTGISPDSLNNQTLHEEGTFPILVMFPLPPIWTIYLH